MIIHRCTVHVLDKNTDAPVLNEHEVRISSDVEKFLQKVIKRVMKSDDLRKATFNNFDKNILCGCTEQIMYAEDTFLENSKEIASYLFDIMRINSELDTCDLAVCLFSQKEEKYLAVLKLDYKKLYTHSIEFVDQKFLVNFVPNEVGIPEGTKPKYGAIISGSMGKNDEYHLSILDDNLKRGEDPSKFVTEFLDATPIEDDAYKTKVFKNAADVWITNTLSDDMKKAEDIRSVLNYKLKQEEEINVEEFIEENIEEEFKESFKEHMEDRGLEEGFLIDKTWIDKKLKKRKIRTDNGFDIQGNLEDFEDPMKYSIRKNPDGSVDLVIKNVNFFEEK